MQSLHHIEVLLCYPLHLLLPSSKIQTLICWVTLAYLCLSDYCNLYTYSFNILITFTRLPLEISSKFFISNALFLLISLSFSIISNQIRIRISWFVFKILPPFMNFLFCSLMAMCFYLDYVTLFPSSNASSFTLLSTLISLFTNFSLFL